MADLQTSLSFADSGSGSGGQSKDRKRKGGSKDWDHPHSEARKGQSTGSYPDYFSWKTRSGHVFQLDDTQGGETVTLQHRGGTAIQIRSEEHTSELQSH